MVIMLVIKSWSIMIMMMILMMMLMMIPMIIIFVRRIAIMQLVPLLMLV